MKQAKSYKFMAATAVMIIALLWGMCFSCVPAYAESGNVNSCTVNRCYRHPVTGVIEDSGGEGSYATGQGMVEGCLYNYGLLEETDSGQCYLTVRMGLSDYTSGLSFQTQSWGGSGWNSVSVSNTGSGSDSNGATADYCIPVPSRDCVVKGSMYVEPMGRDVVFFFYPSGFSAGNNVGMAATHVTSSGSKNTESKKTETAEQAKPDKMTADDVEKLIESIGKVTINSKDKIDEERNAYEKLSKKEKAAVENYDKLKDAEDQYIKLKTQEIEKPDTEGTLDSAKGLTLSTEKEAGGNGKTAAMILCGIVLIGAAGGGIYYVKKNKKGSGDTRDDEE